MATMRVPEQKVILCGEYGAGKSSIFRRFTNNTFVTASDRQSTLGLDHYDRTYTVDNKELKVTQSTATGREFIMNTIALPTRAQLQLWDTGGMERVASVTSSYYKFAEAAILVFALDNVASFHALSQHMLDIVSYAENAKIVLCGNKSDLEPSATAGAAPQVTDQDMEEFCEQCQDLISGTFKISCKTGEGVEEMFQEVANMLVETSRSRLELKALEQRHGAGFKVQPRAEDVDVGDGDGKCIC